MAVLVVWYCRDIFGDGDTCGDGKWGYQYKLESSALILMCSPLMG